MNKILIGSFLTAALIISGTANVKAQSKTNAKVIKREAVKKDMPSKKVVETKKLNTTAKKVALKKETSSKKVVKTKQLNTTTNKVVVKKVAQDKMKAQPAKVIKREAVKKDMSVKKVATKEASKDKMYTKPAKKKK